MTRAEREQRELRREMLILRAAIERTELAAQLDSIDARTRVGRAVAGALLGHSGPTAGGWLGVATSVVRFARSQPWIIPTAVGALARVTRSRPLRWIALVAVAAGVLWWARGTRRGPQSHGPVSDEGEASQPDSTARAGSSTVDSATSIRASAQ